MDEDSRIIDLDLENPTLPDFFYRLEQPINMTLCAGDGIQQGMTDIEWFVRKRIGFSREEKPTNIFITTKNYNPEYLESNKTYLRSRPKLKVILLIYDDKNPKWKENLSKLFPGLINNIYEDNACAGEILDLKTLHEILREGGTYTTAKNKEETNLFMRNLYSYKNYLQFFTIDLTSMPRTIIKNNANRLILPSDADWENKYTNSLVDTLDDGDRLTHVNTYGNGLERFKLDVLEDEFRSKAKAKLSNCDTDTDCKFFGKNGVCIEKQCIFDEKGGKKKKTKRSRKNKKSKKTKRAKKTIKY